MKYLIHAEKTVPIELNKEDLLDVISALILYTDTIPDPNQLHYKMLVQRLFEDLSKFED